MAQPPTTPCEVELWNLSPPLPPPAPFSIVHVLGCHRARSVCAPWPTVILSLFSPRGLWQPLSRLSLPAWVIHNFSSSDPVSSHSASKWKRTHSQIISEMLKWARHSTIFSHLLLYSIGRDTKYLSWSFIWGDTTPLNNLEIDKFYNLLFCWSDKYCFKNISDIINLRRIINLFLSLHFSLNDNRDEIE